MLAADQACDVRDSEADVSGPVARTRAHAALGIGNRCTSSRTTEISGWRAHRLGDSARKSLAIDGEGRARRDARRIGGAHDDRSQPAHLFLQQTDGVVELVAAKRVAADELGEVAGLDARRSAGPAASREAHARTRSRRPARRLRIPARPPPDHVHSARLTTYSPDGSERASWSSSSVFAAGHWRRCPLGRARARAGAHGAWAGSGARIEPASRPHRDRRARRRAAPSLRQRRVRRPVADVGPVAARRAPRSGRRHFGVRSKLGEHRLGGLWRRPAAFSARREGSSARIERDGEHIGVRFERSEFVAALHIRTEAAEVGNDGLAVGRMGADFTRQGQQPQRIVERQGRRSDRRCSDSAAGFGALNPGPAFRPAARTGRSGRAGVDVLPGLGIDSRARADRRPSRAGAPPPSRRSVRRAAVVGGNDAVLPSRPRRAGGTARSGRCGRGSADRSPDRRRPRSSDSRRLVGLPTVGFEPGRSPSPPR